jgi:hypothetical protein
MACKKACHSTLEEKFRRRTQHPQVQRYFQWDQILECSFECVEKSHARDRSLRLECRVASCRRSSLSDAHGLSDISMAHLTVRGKTLRLPAQKDRA